MQCGVYRHYKGEKYLVIGTAVHEKTQELLVVYIPLYNNEFSSMFVRNYKEFNGNVVHEGKLISRFIFCGIGYDRTKAR